MKKILLFVFLFFAIAIGLYPLIYFLFDMSGGLIGSKSAKLLAGGWWYAGFYTHISFGGLALLSGCTQFIYKLRQKRLGLHRNLGKVYVISVVLSGSAGLGIAFFASTGITAQLGFGTLACLWLFSTLNAYFSIRKMDLSKHERWMVRSYALCFAAVTLRLWLPLFTGGLGLSFSIAYPIIAWLCWVPNLLVAELINRSMKASLA